MTSRSHHNGLRTAALFGVLWALLLGIGALVSGGRYILLFGLGGVVMTFITYWNSDKIAIRSMHAQPVTRDEQPVMYRIVEELAAKANQPMPRLYVSPTASPNAFATGRNPRNAAVCCTQGILSLLDERELRGVLGHELMHVYNRDILTSSIAAAIAGVITSVAQFLLIFGGGGRGRQDQNPIGMIGALLAALLAPFATMLIQSAISRTREFDADHDGATLTADPLALASALHKLEYGIARAPLARTPNLQDTAHMMISHPFGPQAVSRLMSSHPPTEERIARLEALAGRV